MKGMATIAVRETTTKIGFAAKASAMTPSPAASFHLFWKAQCNDIELSQMRLMANSWL
jgi:hypothetical protein